MLASTCKKTAGRIDTTLQPASCFRLFSPRADHDLPRLASQYVTVSRRSQSPTTAVLASRLTEGPPQFVTGSSRQTQPFVGNHDLRAFLRQKLPLTIVPSPLPSDISSSLNSFWFPDSRGQSLVAIIDTCLNECYDVPRARTVFETMRMTGSGEHLLNTAIFNKLLKGYASMALQHTSHQDEWLREAWVLFDSMVVSDDGAKPNAETYAIMLLLWKRHSPESSSTVSSNVSTRSPEELLRLVLACDMPLTSLVPACRLVAEDEECDKLVRLISRTTAAMGHSKVALEFGQAVKREDLAQNDEADVPDVRPVVRLKRRGDVQVEVQFDEDGSVREVKQPTGDANEEVFEVPYNLRMVRHSLKELDSSHRAMGDDLWSRQRLLEQSSYDVALERLKHEHEMLEKIQYPTGIHDRSLRALMWEWHQKLSKRLRDDISVLVKEEAESLPSRTKLTGSNLRLGPFISLLKPEKLSLIVILELMSMSGTGGIVDGMKITRALIAVGRAVEEEHEAEISRKYGIPSHSYNPTKPRSSKVVPMDREILHERRIAARYQLESAESFRAPWTQEIQLKIGSFLVDCLMDIAAVERHTIDRRTGENYSEYQPAFAHAYEYVRGRKLGVIKLNPAIVERLTRDNVRETIHPRQLPMLTKPRPWVGVQKGGYLTAKTSVMRYKQSLEQYVYLREASEQGRVEPIFAGLDVLSATPWQINREIFEVVVKVWNSGERFLKIPPAVYDTLEPKPPPDLESNPKSKIAHMERMKEWANAKANCHSDRCSINYKLEIARAFIGDVFYFPHNLDFRGRAYPIPPHLNHIGDDLSRSLLKFAEAKPLGDSGLRWLKIHLANLFGFDKASFSERVQFTMSHIDDIYDSAEKPLDGRGWWRQADDPWQCLATCMELRAALESPDPKEFSSYLPVHQDGTCNGLQHYAALGGDKQGAKQVNLDVTDRPSDVYTYVANMLDAAIVQDAANGVPEAQAIQGKVTRKVVKQTVMTTVYGVTYVGARDQIERQLRGKVPSELRWNISSYLARKTLDAIGDLFSGAKAIQNWLTLSAKLIAKSIPEERLEAATSVQTAAKKGKASKLLGDNRVGKEQMTSVIWTTALGLPIVQPYRKVKRRQVKTKIQSVYISDPNAPAEVDANKQASAFPPNFVHSLDATHMLLTALACRKAEVTFAAVHDSYWTHACTIDQMSAFIRETFIELHSSDVLPKLAAEFRNRYANHKVPLRVSDEAKIIQHSLKKPSIADSGTNTRENSPDSGSERCLPLNSDAGDTSLSEDDNLPRQPTGFVNLVDILPPLPEKGTFEVSKIKDSLYFFS